MSCIIADLRTDQQTLVLVGHSYLTDEEIRSIRSLKEVGAEVVAWQHNAIVQDRFPCPDIKAALRQRGIQSRDPAEILSSDVNSVKEIDFAVEEKVISWFKTFGRDKFRSRYRHGPMVLWWWAELYLYHETPFRLAIRDVELVARLASVISPQRIVLIKPVRDLEAAARAFVGHVDVIGECVAGPPSLTRTTSLHFCDLFKMVGTGIKSLFRRQAEPLRDKSGFFFLTHSSMWRAGREMYFGSVLSEIKKVVPSSVVAFGPMLPFKRRTFVSEVREQLEFDEKELPYRLIRYYFTWALGVRLITTFSECRRMWKDFRGTVTLSHHGVKLGSEAYACFHEMFLRQLPWAIRAYHEILTAMESEKAKGLVLYAESSGLGRAAIMAARTLKVPSFAIQHGIMYPHYYSHEHAPFELDQEEEGEAVPIPTKTAVFGNMAKDLLVKRGSYDPKRIVVTGSSKFDELVLAATDYDREKIRNTLLIPPGHRFLVLATRWSAVESVFSELIEAVQRFPNVWLLIKPHQAESPNSYTVALEKLSAEFAHFERIRVVSGSDDLLELLFASDGLVTVDSLASSEALVLGRPVLVLNSPNNLDVLVERGVALGVSCDEDLSALLRKLLFDNKLGEMLQERRREYIQEFAFGADGRATERIVKEILETARNS